MRERAGAADTCHKLESLGQAKPRQPLGAATLVETIVIFDVGDALAAQPQDKALRPAPGGVKWPQRQRITQISSPMARFIERVLYHRPVERFPQLATIGVRPAVMAPAGPTFPAEAVS